MTPLHCSPESKSQLAMTEPRNDEVIFGESIFDQVGIVGAPSIAYGDGMLINDDLGAGMDELAKDRARVLQLMTVADMFGK